VRRLNESFSATAAARVGGNFEGRLVIDAKLTLNCNYLKGYWVDSVQYNNNSQNYPTWRFQVTLRSLISSVGKTVNYPSEFQEVIIFGLVINTELQLLEEDIG
jgi:hypothetical protein